MGLLQSGDLPMNLFIFFFLFFSTQVINFQGNNLSKFGAIHMNPVEGQPQLIRVVTAPPSQRCVFL